ncbi:MAG: tetratricopeptide repeat protein [Verrucomicrobia bacterium]|nr:tetratricopeptide repeat protein [Verrucomicrobiota bacterium]
MKKALAIKFLLYLLCTVGMVIFFVLFRSAFAAKTQTHVEPPPDATTNVTAPVTNAAATGSVPAARAGSFPLYLALMLACGAGLALLLARDVSAFLAEHAADFVFNDDLRGQRSPEYEAAESEWNNGNHLEAVRLLREYYTRYPREVYVALRMAEIYETNLKNPLAAALEYEEILKKKLPPERWGWAAIHLANLYSGPLGKTDQALELLNRIVTEYGTTAAAKKARTRLGLPEPQPQTADGGKPQEKKPAKNLPSGFSPRAKDEAHLEPASATIDDVRDEGEDEDEDDTEGSEDGAASPQPKNLPAGFRPKEPEKKE